LTEATQGSPSFTELGLCDEVVRAVADAGYAEPTPIQSKAIPHILEKKDLVGIAQTGTGKTAAFVLPIIHRLLHGRARARMPRSVILSPTRELASQTAENFTKYGQNVKLSMALIIGGVGMGDQEKLLDRGVDVLIATPGRLLDWFERGKVLLGGVSIFVIDEADRMLDMGFIPDVERLAKLIARREQTLLFSATMPKEVRRLADQFLRDPVEVQVARPASTVANIEARLVRVRQDKKSDALERLFKHHGVDTAIIFCNRKRDVGTLTRKLQRKGYNARDIHGDLEQAHRQATLDAFKRGEVSYLVATDVAARGLDISDMPVVINLDVPSHADDYVHRIGRTGRAGRKGRAFTFATDDDDRRLAKIEKLIGGKIATFDPFAAPAAATEAAPQPEAAPEPEAAPVSEAAAAPAAAKPRRRRGKAAPKTEPAAATEQPAATEQQAASEPAGAGGKAPKRRRAPKKAPADEQATAPADETAAREPAREETGEDKRGGGRGRNRKREREAGEPVVGLGDHVPSFLLRPVPVRPAPSSSKGD
jgi:superfamily II DNA/RNA helicase